MPSVPYRTGNMRWWPVPAARCRWNPDMARQRQIDVRSLVIVLALLVAACSGSHISSRRPQGAPAQPAPNLHTTLPATPGRSSAPMSARVVLPSPAMTAGSSMPGRIVVENNTGRAIHVSGCWRLFQVALTSNKYQPAVAWPTCSQTFTIPVGESSYPATVEASYSQCSPGRPHGAVRACLPNRRPPPLPPGDYHAMLFQVGNLVPVPPAITVRVTPPEPARQLPSVRTPLPGPRFDRNILGREAPTHGLGGDPIGPSRSVTGRLCA